MISQRCRYCRKRYSYSEADHLFICKSLPARPDLWDEIQVQNALLKFKAELATKRHRTPVQGRLVGNVEDTHRIARMK